MKYHYIFFPILVLVSSCTPPAPTLEAEIQSHVDTWGGYWKSGASLKHWELLDRIVAVDDVDRRIRLVTEIRSKLKPAPERLPSICGNINEFDQRMLFARTCAERLDKDRENHPKSLVASWKLESSLLDDLEKMIFLTEEIWHEGKEDVRAPQEMRDMWNLARYVRRRYELYFKYTLPCCIGTYRRLPELARPAFAEQIKHDFFRRPGMKYVDLSKFPPEFK